MNYRRNEREERVVLLCLIHSVREHLKGAIALIEKGVRASKIDHEVLCSRIVLADNAAERLWQRVR